MESKIGKSLRLLESGKRKSGKGHAKIFFYCEKYFHYGIIIALNKWLQDFAYRTPIAWWIFALAAGVAFIIALFTVSFQSIKAATANPVKSLKNE